MLIKKLHGRKTTFVAFVLRQRWWKHIKRGGDEAEMWVGWLEAAWVRWWWRSVQAGSRNPSDAADAAALQSTSTDTHLVGTPTSSAAFGSSLRGPPGCPFLTRPWENSLIRGYQLER